MEPQAISSPPLSPGVSVETACDSALQLPFGVRILSSDPQRFRQEFDTLRTTKSPKYDRLIIRSAPLNSNEIWIIRVPEVKDES